jgi:hypothetical protein
VGLAPAKEIKTIGWTGMVRAFIVDDDKNEDEDEDED